MTETIRDRGDFPARECCICGGFFTTYGNNPRPFAGGRCCDHCNDWFVVPARILLGGNAEPDSNAMTLLKRFAQYGRVFAGERRASKQEAARNDPAVENIANAVDDDRQDALDRSAGDPSKG
jgi:hypothetical protein